MLVLCSTVSAMKNDLRAQDDRWTDEVLMKYSSYLIKRNSQANGGRLCSTQDSQRSKVYQSEWAFQRKFGNGQEFKTMKQAERYLQKVMRSKAWEKLADGKRCYLGTIQGRANQRTAGRAHYGGRIELSPAGMNEYTLLHELAHQSGNMHHDVGFRQDLLALVSRFMGREAAGMLKAEFKERKLKLTIPKAKAPEAWLESYYRAQKMRASL